MWHFKCKHMNNYACIVVVRLKNFAATKKQTKNLSFFLMPAVPKRAAESWAWEGPATAEVLKLLMDDPKHKKETRNSKTLAKKIVAEFEHWHKGKWQDSDKPLLPKELHKTECEKFHKVFLTMKEAS